MNSWAEERDRVVKQPLSFAEATSTPPRARPVTTPAPPAAVAAQPPAAAQPITPQPITPKAIIPESILPLAVTPPIIPQPIAATPSSPDVVTVKPVTRPLAGPARPKIDPAPPVGIAKLSERAEISMRVAAFKDHQIKIRRAREEYYEATLAKTRAALSNSIAGRNSG